MQKRDVFIVASSIFSGETRAAKRRPVAKARRRFLLHQVLCGARFSKRIPGSCGHKFIY
jgi:hypothetical protein